MTRGLSKKRYQTVRMGRGCLALCTARISVHCEHDLVIHNLMVLHVSDQLNVDIILPTFTNHLLFPFLNRKIVTRDSYSIGIISVGYFQKYLFSLSKAHIAINMINLLLYLELPPFGNRVYIDKSHAAMFCHTKRRLSQYLAKEIFFRNDKEQF